jgi:oligopeptide transport system ATP-binding protein
MSQAVPMSQAAPPLLRVEDLGVNFGAHAAIREVSFDLCAAETLGLVGESGSGKSTLARAILRLVRAARGKVLWRGQDLLLCEGAELRSRRRDLQIIFQDPLASLNPRMTAGETIAEPLRIFEPGLTAHARAERVGDMLERVGLAAGMQGRYPHEFSGGQCQRVGIARAMVLGPQLLICDEPVSSLDASIQGQIVNLLLDLQRDAGTAMLFISHNLAIVRHLSHRILVMYSGRLVEIAPRDRLFAAPTHPYTRTLLAAVPAREAVTLPPHAPHAPHPAHPPQVPLAAQPSSSADPGAWAPRATAAGAWASRLPNATTESGCAYRDRCAYALALCAATVPTLDEVAAGHFVACHRSREFMP